MPKGFFRLVWRFNALAIAAVSGISLFVGAYATYHVARDLFRHPYQTEDVARVEQPADGDTPQPAVKTDVSLSHFSSIRGSPILWATLDARQTYDFRYSSKEASSTRNVVFYDMAKGESRKLLADDKRLIVERRELRKDDAPSNDPPTALFFLLIETDTDKDGLLTQRDAWTIAFSRVNGEELTRIEGAAGSVYGVTLNAGGNEAVTIVEAGGGLSALHIDLETFKVMRRAKVSR